MSVKKKRGRKKVDAYMKISHVKALTKKYYGYGEKKRFKTKKDLDNFTRDVYDQYVLLNHERVTLKKIRSFVKESIGSYHYRKETIEIKPQIQSEFQGIQPYYILKDLAPALIGWNNIIVYSNSVLPKGMRLYSGQYYTYENTFKPFVDHINTLNKKRISGTIDFYFRFVEEGMKKVDNGFWEVEVVSCDEIGNAYNYGFNNKNPEESMLPEGEIKDRIDEQQESTVETIKEKEIPVSKEVKEIRDEIKSIKESEAKEIKNIRVEKEKKMAKREELMQIQRSKFEYAKMMKELGEDAEYKKTLSELKSINEQISKL